MRRYIPAFVLLVLGAVPFVSACGLIDKMKGGGDADAGDAAAVTTAVAAVEAGAPTDTATPPTTAPTATATLTTTAVKPVVKGDAAAPVADAGAVKTADGGVAPTPTPNPFPNLQFDAGGFPKLQFPDGGLKFPGQK
jgi:hypothetical protein